MWSLEPFADFKEKIKRVFDDINTERIAEQDLIRIYSRKSAATYATEFQSIIANINWTDVSLTI